MSSRNLTKKYTTTIVKFKLPAHVAEFSFASLHSAIVPKLIKRFPADLHVRKAAPFAEAIACKSKIIFVRN